MPIKTRNTPKSTLLRYPFKNDAMTHDYSKHCNPFRYVSPIATPYTFSPYPNVQVFSNCKLNLFAIFVKNLRNDERTH